ncbi:hypothetical protein [Sphingomonas soli]|uniref:hypothetical protein n=1 Tax=Sphingomonas soli TaxID=266127 RepID=UPI0012ED5462|nr:hypothetical protein [Sphingomonas soli]
MRRLAVTLGIVAPLSILFYLAVRLLAEGLPGAQYWLTITLCGPFCAAMAAYVFDGFRTGQLPLWRADIVRADEPIRYWAWMLWFGSLTMALLGLLLYAIGNLAPIVSP